MKKVWILERWLTPEEMARTLKEFEIMAEEAKTSGDAEYEAKSFELVEKIKVRNSENPDGMWMGSVGRTNYKAFCVMAKDELRWFAKERKFRVVEAEIRDDAETWLKYVNPKENAGVMRYLMATKGR